MTADEAIGDLAIRYVPAIYQRVLRALEDGPKSRAGLLAILDVTKSTIDRTLQILKGAELVHIHKQINNVGHGGLPEAFYAIGSGEDAPRPPAKRPDQSNTAQIKRARAVRREARLKAHQAANSRPAVIAYSMKTLLGNN